jgi:lycopene beta-cyclase
MTTGTPASTAYDYIIAGAGASGLNLAHALGDAGLNDARVLLVDRAPKTANDRTWCFWEAGDNMLESVIHRRWSKLAFHGPGLSTVLRPAPYTYKMLRGIDFYQHMDILLAARPGVTRLYGAIEALEEAGDHARVRVDGRDYSARYAFSSLPPPLPADPRYHNLLQHFLGWMIRTEEPRFDPETATLMDFRIDQGGDTRFIYVLPLDRRSALVEYTVFSTALLKREQYAHALRHYIEHDLKIDEYAIEHEEYGVIPMSDMPMPRQPSAHVMNIGTAGGASKPSTGYTFLRTQRQARRIVEALRANGTPFYNDDPAALRYRVFDSTLLNVLDNGRMGGAQVFADLFAKNPAELIFKFLDEDTTLIEDLKIMSSVRIPTFLRAMLGAVFRKRG